MDFVLLRRRAESNDDDDDDNAEERKLFLRPDASKKSVFWLETASPDAQQSNNDADATTAPQEHHVCVPAPVEGIITRRFAGTNGDSTFRSMEERLFAWGGMQVTSNAKSIEIYYTPPTMPPMETYLTTIKGIPANININGKSDLLLYKALCAVPGGPRGVVSVRLKFLTLQPKETTSFRLAALKWTARVAPPAAAKSTTNGQQKSAATAGHHPSMAAAITGSGSGIHHHHHHGSHEMASQQGLSMSATLQAGLPSSPPLTKDDVAAAMAGMTFALRSTEERVTKQIATLAETQQKYWQITSQQQAQWIQYQNALIQKQQELLTEQTKMIQSLQEQQQRMNESMEQLSIAKLHRPAEPAKTDSSSSVTLKAGKLGEGSGRDQIAHSTEQRKTHVPDTTLTVNWLQYASMKNP